MPDEPQKPQHEAPPPRRWRFSLRAILVWFVAVSVILAFFVYIPRPTAFTALMATLLVVPLFIATLIREAVVHIGLVRNYWQSAENLAQGQIAPAARWRTILWRTIARPCRYLGLTQREQSPSLGAGATVAVASTATLVGLWPALREIGLMNSLAVNQSLEQTWGYATGSLPRTLSRASYWKRLWQWELWSLGRWWLLLAAIVIVWIIVAFTLKRWLKLEPWSHTLARFLAFAPWLIVLEVGLLIGVWIQSPNVVPEPSTGFVVGIFSWDLWHWDCWLDEFWLVRSTVPMVIVGTAFFAQVLRWRWWVAVTMAIPLVPISIVSSVACSVAYSHGLPPLF